MKSSAKKAVIIILFFIILILLFLLSDNVFSFADDKTVQDIIKETVMRMACALFLVIVIVLTDFAPLYIKRKPQIKLFLLCLPCFAVCIANFPFSALLLGNAMIERVDLMGLWCVMCVSVGLSEELFFRAIVYTHCKKCFSQRHHSSICAILTSAAVFGLFHLLNLFLNISPLSVFLQVLYSFLLGAMLAFVYEITDNVFLCAFFHTVFNLGGTLVPVLGFGEFQDPVFYLQTVLATAVCLITSLTYMLYKPHLKEHITVKH